MKTARDILILCYFTQHVLTIRLLRETVIRHRMILRRITLFTFNSPLHCNDWFTQHLLPSPEERRGRASQLLDPPAESVHHLREVLRLLLLHQAPRLAEPGLQGQCERGEMNGEGWCSGGHVPDWSIWSILTIKA